MQCVSQVHFGKHFKNQSLKAVGGLKFFWMVLMSRNVNQILQKMHESQYLGNGTSDHQNEKNGDHLIRLNYWALECVPILSFLRQC